MNDINVKFVKIRSLKQTWRRENGLRAAMKSRDVYSPPSSRGTSAVVVTTDTLVRAIGELGTSRKS